MQELTAPRCNERSGQEQKKVPALQREASWLGHLLHRVYAEVRLNLTQVEKKGRNYDSSEWFVVPYDVINQAVTMIMSGEITNYVYDKAERRLVERDR